MKETGFFISNNEKKLSTQEKPIMKKQSNESNMNQLVEIKKGSPPKLPKSPPPHILTQSSGLANDSSDDEVKDYLTHKETINYDEISHV